jgi:hypothetical protein
MAEVINTILKDPENPDRTLKDILHDVVERNDFGRKLVRFDIRPKDVELIYQTPV